MMNWRHLKTTSMGLVICAIAVKGSIHFDAAGHLLMTARDWFEAGCGFIAAGIGLSQQDAGKQEAVVPGKAEPELVDSHETPNDPTATPVK